MKSYRARVRRTTRVAAGVFGAALVTGAWSYGTDSNTVTLYGSAPNETIYIGKLYQRYQQGHNPPPNYCEDSSSPYFRTARANVVGKNRTFGFAFVFGPVDEPAGTSDYDYGVIQASGLYNCWYSGPYANYVYGATLFGDFEIFNTQTDNGWLYPAGSGSKNSTRNYEVIRGFENQLHALLSSWSPGFYAGLAFLGDHMAGQGPDINSWVYWNAGGCPAHSINSQTSTNINGHLSTYTPSYWQTNAVNFHNQNMSSKNCLGLNQGVSVWQFGYGSADYNLTPQEQDIALYAGWGDGTL